MLGYDAHAGHYELLQDIVTSSDKPKLRQMALGLLAADSGSKNTFAKIAADRTESGRPLHERGRAAGTCAEGIQHSRAHDRGRRGRR